MLDSQVATQNAAAPAGARRESLTGRAWRLIRENRALVILLGVATVIRLLIMIAYQPALWYGGDSGAYISEAFERLRPQANGAVGYVVLLKILRHTGTLFSVVAVQHLLGLLMAVAIYALLRHRGVRPWVACVATTPVLFDSLELVLEHAILVETLAMALMVAAIVLVFWSAKPGTTACVLAGLLIIGAWFVRPTLLPVVILLAVYLAIRRIGWRAWVAFVLAVGIPYLYVVQVFVGPKASPYTANYISYYARVAGFAKCDQLTLTDAERTLCPSAAASGNYPGWYIWQPESPGYPYHIGLANYPVLKQFTIDVVRQQPMDYLRTVGVETAAQFVDGIPLREEYRCTSDLYLFARTYRAGGPGPSCRAQLASGDFRWQGRSPEESPRANALTTSIETYGSVVRTPRLAVLGVYALTVAAVVVRMRRRERAAVEPTGEAEASADGGETVPARSKATGTARRDGVEQGLVRDAATLAVAGLTMIVLPTLVFMYATRYALPALPLMCIVGGMAAESLLRGRARTA
jgi:hypothetical protein